MPTPKLLFPSVDGPLTRERLHDGSLLAALRASAPPGMVLRSDEELAASLDETLATHPADEPLWLFGYGSLMWNPAIHYLDALPATVRGWSRRFCLWLYTARGTPEVPGLMLALDRGGVVRAVGLDPLRRLGGGEAGGRALQLRQQVGERCPPQAVMALGRGRLHGCGMDGRL